MKIYEIDKAIDELIDYETGEILDINKFHQLKMAKDEKISNIISYIKNLDGELELLINHEIAIKEKKERKKKHIANLKEFLSEVLNGHKFKNAFFSAYYSKTQRVDVVNEDILPKQFFKPPKPLEVDKLALKKALKDGMVIDGATLVEKEHLVIR